MTLVSTAAKQLPGSAYQTALTARNLSAEAWPIMGSSGILAAVGGVGASSNLVGSLVGLQAGTTVTNVITFIGGAGTAVTLVKLAIFDTAGNLLGVSADVKASLVANTPLVAALTTPYNVPTTGGYMLCGLTLAGTTQPTLIRATSLAGSGSRIGTAARPSILVAAQSDITGAVTFTNGDNGFWFACN